MKNRESKTIKKTATALVVTVEKFQKDSLSDYQTQGDCKPYTKCRTSSIPRRLVECLSGYKDIKKSIGDLKRVLKNWNISDVHSFVFIISNIIGAEATLERKQRAKNVDEISYYLNLPQYSFRLGLHNLKAKNYQGNRQKKSNYGVTFKEPNLPNTFEAKDGVNVVEYVYVYWTPELLRKVAQAILHLLETGQWDESIAPADAKNISPMKKNEKVGKLQGIKTGASRGKTKKTKYLCDTCQWYVGCTWCKDGKKSVCDGYKPYNTDYEYPSFDGICGAKKNATALIYKIPLKVKDVYKSGEKMNISLARNMAIGLDLSENELMQLCELGLVIEAKRIAHLNEPLKFRFEKMVDLYGRQLTIQPKDSRSATLQQYSTPCPLAFLLGEYVKKGTEEREDDNIKFFEPTAGNGLLTISFRAYQMVVNELDDIRFNNLKRLGFFRTTNEDATCSSEPLKCFSGIIANPPFAPLEKKDFLVRKGVVDGREATYEFDRLDHKIAIMALDHMKDDGRAAIIIGGKMAVKLKDYKESYWKNGVLFGGFRNFITYLNRQYNIEDILYINGDLYRKQGTTFPIVAILINGRTKWNGDKRHQWHPFDKSKDGQIDTFNELYHRMGIHLEEEPTAKNKLIVDSRNTMRLAFNHLVKELGEEEGKKTFEWYCKTYDVNIGDPMPASVRREIFGVESVPSALKAKALMLKMKMAKSRGLEGTATDSVAITFNKMLLLYSKGRLKKHEIFVCKAPDFWIDKGLECCDVMLPVSVIEKAMVKHELLLEHFVNFPDSLRKGNELFLSKSVKGAYVQLTELRDYKNNRVVVAIHLRRKDTGYVVYKIASVHGRVERQLDKWRGQNLNL